jgi:uncharacterized protein YodC (DUF2158 family)
MAGRDDQFQIGDVVRLRSGGPAMTVSAQHSNGKYNCQWFVDGEVKVATFAGESLEQPE